MMWQIHSYHLNLAIIMGIPIHLAMMRWNLVWKKYMITMDILMIG